MNETYDPHTIEARWQAHWSATQQNATDLDSAARPFYNLVEFPYPSGEGLHVGHVFSFSGADTYGRFQRRRGYSVFQPIGFDAFGIHSENYALKVGVHPYELTRRSTARFRAQLQQLGAAFDWSRVVDTSDPAYYRWTQWIFIQLFKAGLAYRAEAAVNWCPACQTVLSNEQVIDGRCERCDTLMQRRTATQWFLRITRYADRLLDFGAVDFATGVIKRQQGWIGRSAGVEIDFPIAGTGATVTVFTTRPETIPAARFVALAPEHPLAAQVAQGSGAQAAAVRALIAQSSRRLELERQQAASAGVDSGLQAIHPISGERLPIWIAEYVLGGYGTGAIMGVPAHDERDQRFAEQHGIATDAPAAAPPDPASLPPTTAPRPSVQYRLRDWLISRQRYWGPPIPIVYCAQCGTQPVPEQQLPVLLPPLEQFRPSGSAPLAAVESFVQTSCPQCGGPARRETDVSDNFLDSAWYFLRYTATERDDAPWDAERVARWLPVALYTGGPEHATMHHLYARFICMALHDLGLLPFAEPFARLRLHGTITRDGRKMSKSRGNVVNPDTYIARYGADVTRMALLFLGPFDADADFSDHGVAGMARFLRRVWDAITTPAPLTDATPAAPPLEWAAQSAQLIRRVTADLEAQHYHTAIAALMEYTTWLRGALAQLPPDQLALARYTLVLLLAPFAPHLAEELWQRLGGSGSVHTQPWPTPTATSGPTGMLPVQVDGRLRDQLAPADACDEASVRAAAQAQPKLRAAIGGRAIVRVVIVPGRVVNIVTGG